MKKAIVLDLDNTLWGGVVGEDGIDGIKLSLTPPGASFIAFQQALMDLYNRGVILAVNSANNEADALAVIRTHPNMILKEHHFAAMRMNWEDKVENMRSLANELNIGLDSMVFLDDNPTNCAAMRTFLPEVETPELPADPAHYAKFLLSLPYFSSEAVTDEDKMRGNMYVTERLRRSAEKQHADKRTFLESLGLEISLARNDTNAVARIAQLSEKTNQFNTNKHPMSEEEVAVYMATPDCAIFTARVIDIFGDYGLTAVAFVVMRAGTWEIDSLLMSCRVLGRGIEEAFIYAIAREAIAAGAASLSLVFVPTEKNRPAQDFLEKYFSTQPVAAASVSKPAWVHIV